MKWYSYKFALYYKMFSKNMYGYIFFREITVRRKKFNLLCILCHCGPCISKVWLLQYDPSVLDPFCVMLTLGRLACDKTCLLISDWTRKSSSLSKQHTKVRKDKKVVHRSWVTFDSFLDQWFSLTMQIILHKNDSLLAVLLLIARYF